jgi:heavy metal efflux system protein
VFFLGNLKTVLIAAVNIQLALLGAFMLIRIEDTPANLFSLGAIDFAIIINSTVIAMENIHRPLTSSEPPHESERLKILRAAQEVGGALAIMILTRVLQPVLTYVCHRKLRLADESTPRPEPA